MTKVVFPCDQETWWLVKDGLHSLKEICLMECCDLPLLAEAHQVIVNTNLGLGEHGNANLGNTAFYGLIKYLDKHASTEERTRFLQVTLPSIIDLTLKMENLLPAEGITINEQQKGETKEIDRRLCCSIVACAFLCLFPNEQRGYRTKLSSINFNKFFANLPISSQNAKLQCILHFFDRVSAGWDRITGSVQFTRQVVMWDELPTLDTWLNCTSQLCQVTVYQEGLIEDAGCDTVEVDFANRYIGGGVLGRGRVQEEIRFTVCPELIVSLLFMEFMEENEAIVIKGYEQFASTEGYASDLKFAGDHRDPALTDEDGNLKNTLCAIDAISYRNDQGGSVGRQYQDHFVLRDLNKAFTGFCTPFTIPHDEGSLLVREEDYFTAEDSNSSDHDEDYPNLEYVNCFVDDLLKSALTLALPEAATYCPNYVGRKDAGQASHPDPDDSQNSQSTTSVEEVPMAHLEVNFRDWYSHYRRRSSNLSDLSSRRSSYDLSRRSSACSNRGNSSEFSSEFEEYFDNFQQQEQKYKYHTITEEVGSSLVSEFAANLAANLLKQGTMEASYGDHGVQDFNGDQPTGVKNKPLPMRISENDEAYCECMNEVYEDTVRKYVGNMFQNIWPFGERDNEKRDLQNKEKKYIRERILDEYCSHLDIPDTLQNTDNEADDDGDSDTEHDSPIPEVCSENDERILIDVAEHLVNRAFEEALVEFKYRYVSRKFESQLSIESSQSDHSIDLTDQLEIRNQAQTFESNQSDSSNKFDLHKYDLSAVTVADRVLSELFRNEDDGKPGGMVSDQQQVQSNIPNLDTCDNYHAASAAGSAPQSQTHSTSISDTDRKAEKRLEMYSRIADKLLMGGFPSKTSDEDAIANLIPEVSVLNLNQSCDVSHGQSPDHSQQTRLSHDWNSDQSQISDLKVDRPAFSSSPLSCDSLSSHLLSSVNLNNQMPSNLEESSKTSGLKTEGQLSRSNSEKSSRISSKRSSSSSSEGKCAISISDHSFSNSSSTGSDVKISKNMPSSGNSSSPLNHSTGNSSSPLNQSSGSDKTGSESSVPKVPQTGSRKMTPADISNRQQAARPKVRPKEGHHIVGNKKNYDQFANTLSRDLLTNAFLQVQEHNEFVCQPRRSSEPMQISNGAALQRLEYSKQTINGKRAQISKTAEDICQFEEGWVQRESFCDRDYRSSSGFRDPVLSRFAEELMKANVSVPTLQLLSDCVSTSGSSRSVCSTVSSFRDPILATFEEELVNSTSGKSSAKTQMSWSKMKGSLCSPRQNERKSSVNNNSIYSNSSSNHDNSSSYHSNRKQRINGGTSIESETSGISWKLHKSNSVICSENVSKFAESLARRIMCEAMTAAYCTMNMDPGYSGDVRRRTRMTLDMYSDMLARNILKCAVLDAENRQVCSDWLEQNKIVTWSEETECLEYSGEDNTDTSDTTDDDRLVLNSPESGSSSLEYEDALDIPYSRLEEFADVLASKVLINSVAISRRERMSALRRQYGRSLATGNWGCGAFCGDPHLKSLLQWIAASYAGTPRMLFYTFKHPHMVKFQSVVDTVLDRGWDVSNLMQAVRRYCITAESEIRQNGYASHDLFDVILQGELFPGMYHNT